jgi:hypothetical protein
LKDKVQNLKKERENNNVIKIKNNEFNEAIHKFEKEL